MKKSCININQHVFILLLAAFVFGQSCDRDNEVEYIGNASIQGKLQYQDVRSGSVKDAPEGTNVTVYFNNSCIPNYTFQTTRSGYWDFVPPAIGSYKVVIRKQDTLVQFSSALVQKEDLDTTRATEYTGLTYIDSATVQVGKNERVLKDFLLRAQVTGLRITAKDEFGHSLKNVLMCLYSNETFYNENFPNCGGSLKYVSTDEAGKALFLGLAPNTSYFVNARGQVGAVTFSNHYAKQAQEFQSGSEGVIQDREVMLK